MKLYFWTFRNFRFWIWQPVKGRLQSDTVPISGPRTVSNQVGPSVKIEMMVRSSPRTTADNLFFFRSILVRWSLTPTSFWFQWNQKKNSFINEERNGENEGFIFKQRRKCIGMQSHSFFWRRIFGEQYTSNEKFANGASSTFKETIQNIDIS